MDETNIAHSNPNSSLSGARSHIASKDLRQDPIVKIFLEDLLEEKLEGLQKAITDAKDSANDVLETTRSLHHDNQELKLSQDLLASSQQRLQEALTTNQQELFDQVCALTHEVNQLKGPRKRTADQISDVISKEDMRTLIAKIAQQKNHIAQMEKELDKKQNECVCIRESHQEALNEIEQIRSTGRLFRTIDDNAVVSRWQELKFSIRNLTQQRLNRPSKFFLSAPNDRYFKAASEEYQCLLGQRDYAAFVFQGVIWSFLVINILEIPAKVWGVPLGNAISGSIKGRLLIHIFR